jgi:murein DD-endopeptidase MepM/ murein hydrolase activator NlpD
MSATSFNKAQISRGVLSIDHVTELVRHWQASHGLVTDGHAGPKTVASIESALRPHGLPLTRAWPLGTLPDGRRPQITSAFHTENPDRAEPGNRHLGVDLFYRYDPRHDGPVRIGDGGASGRNGMPRWWIPPGTVALAAAAGRVHVAGKGRTGYRVWIDHGGGVYTGYFHLSDHAAALSRGDTVALGEPLGLVGDNPAAFDATHLHFELYLGDLDSYPSHSANPKIWLDDAIVLDGDGREPKSSDDPQVHSPT